MTPLQRISSEFDADARLSCDRLRAEFKASLEADIPSLVQDRPSLGAEIEIPWSGYFPDLWVQFGLDRGFSALSLEERLALSEACSAQESSLRPRLFRTVECGVPRGNDRYWEFAFNPVCDWRWLDRQISLLEFSGLLPNNGQRSLQLTIAGLTQGPDAQALARLLECVASNPDRMKAGLESARSVIHTGWARKGSGGVHQKQPEELKGGALVACEFRALLLPQEPARRQLALSTASLAALAIEQSNRADGEPASPLALAWRSWRAECEARLEQVGAGSLTWESSSGLNRGSWDAYMTHWPELASDLLGAWQTLSFGLDGSVEPTASARSRWSR